MIDETLRNNPHPTADESGSTNEESAPQPQNPIPHERDCRAASAQMLALVATTEASSLKASTETQITCRHFRFRVPRGDADELRDADPQPCPVCDVLPHRKTRDIQWF